MCTTALRFGAESGCVSSLLDSESKRAMVVYARYVLCITTRITLRFRVVSPFVLELAPNGRSLRTVNKTTNATTSEEPSPCTGVVLILFWK